MTNSCGNCGCKTENADLIKIIDKYRDMEGALIPVLHEAQQLYGYLPIEVQKIVSEELNIPLADVYGVITFYAQFSTEPKGKNVVSLCMGTACYVKGADKIMDKIKNNLKVKEGDTTEDGLFTLTACRCIGACGLAPVMTINDTVYGRLVPEEIDGILEKYKQAN